MDESYSAITLWPAASLPASVARELHRLEVDLAAQEVNDGLFTARRTPDGTIVLDLSFDNRRYGLTDLEAVLATLRLARISYVAWDEIACVGYAFDPASDTERRFNIVADGKPVLTASDLAQFEDRYRDAEALVDAIRAWLRLPIPDGLSDLADGELTIVTVPDETDEDDDPIEILGEVDGSPGACLQLVGYKEGR
jgi:hypothetical protein